MQLHVAERLPCLDTGPPQAATNSEATVEMLKVPAPSPPFFLLAEDGIRGPLVTGVQTCALPISSCCGGCRCRACQARASGSSATRWCARSEERRVGKECRTRWSPDHLKRKQAREESCTLTSSGQGITKDSTNVSAL